MTALVTELSGIVGVDRACAALDLPRSTYYRRRRPVAAKAPKPRPTPARALAIDERRAVLEVLHSERFVDQAPAAVVATLFEEGVYHCCARTMYRILASQGEVRERRNQLRHPKYERPELMATGPNQVWSWGHHEAARAAEVDLLLPVRAARHLQPLRGRLDARTPRVRRARRAAARGDLPQAGRRSRPAHRARRSRLGADRQDAQADDVRPGRVALAQQTSRLQRQPLLGVELPHLQVATRVPGSLRLLPGRAELQPRHLRLVQQSSPPQRDRDAHARPASPRPGRGRAYQRQRVLDAAYAAHPERFVHGRPKVPEPPRAVWINPPEDKTRNEINLQ